MSEQQDDIIQGIKKLYSDPSNLWKERYDKVFGPTQAVQVWLQIRQNGLLPDARGNLTFLSPTSNVPTHEIAIWKEEISQRVGTTRFLVGDLVSIPSIGKQLEEVKPYLSDNHKFDYFQWNAEQLPVGNQSVDVIWDRKGWLWHCANIKIASEEKSDAIDILRTRRTVRKKLQKAFSEYNRILRVGGILVIDQVDYWYEEFFEPSTVTMIDEHAGRDFGPLKKAYTIKDIGEGDFKTRILIRK